MGSEILSSRLVLPLSQLLAPSALGGDASAGWRTKYDVHASSYSLFVKALNESVASGGLASESATLCSCVNFLSLSSDGLYTLGLVERKRSSCICFRRRDVSCLQQ